MAIVTGAIVTGIQSAIAHWWRDWSRVLAIAVLVVMLSGCVDYDIGIDFRSQTQGTIVQHVRLPERLSAFDRATVRAWTESLKSRARELGGRVRQQRDGDLDVTIPFINGDDLAEKFDRFFGATETELFVMPTANDNLPQVASTLTIDQENYIVAIRNDLAIDLDLRGLSLLSGLGGSPFQAGDGSFVDLRFRLTTPWGSEIAGNSLPPETMSVGDAGSEAVWALAPGQMQHIEASFWVPSPIGIGAIAVVVLTASASFLKHRVLAKVWPKTHGLEREAV